MNKMDIRELTAPCGLDCFNCQLYLASENEELRKKNMELFKISYEEAGCAGCRPENGLCPIRRINGLEMCRVFRCVVEKGVYSCAECQDFPCDNLHPFADRASMLPHNVKVYNLALIRKMGLERWAEDKAKNVRERYFRHPFEI